jgi:hypothetical protein
VTISVFLDYAWRCVISYMVGQLFVDWMKRRKLARRAEAHAQRILERLRSKPEERSE